MSVYSERMGIPVRRLAAISFALLLSSCSPAEREGPVVLAASSLQEAIEDAADNWEMQGNARPVLSFAASSAIARQVELGGPADLVITADREWIDWLGERDLLEGAPRALVTNGLVVVAPLEGDISMSLADFAADEAAGPLAIAEPEVVPAGRFARAALENLDLWEPLEDRIVPRENVRAALALVERGEVRMGIVYASDAQASRRVRVIERLDPSLHPPITYHLAHVSGSRHRGAEDFAEFLLGQQGRAILVARGFGRQ